MAKRVLFVRKPISATAAKRSKCSICGQGNLVAGKDVMSFLQSIVEAGQKPAFANFKAAHAACLEAQKPGTSKACAFEVKAQVAGKQAPSQRESRASGTRSGRAKKTENVPEVPAPKGGTAQIPAPVPTKEAGEYKGGFGMRPEGIERKATVVANRVSSTPATKVRVATNSQKVEAPVSGALAQVLSLLQKEQELAQGRTQVLQTLAGRI